MDDFDEAAAQLQLAAQPFAWDQMTEEQVHRVETFFDPFCGGQRAIFLDDIAPAVERLQRYGAQGLANFLKDNPDIPVNA